MFIYYVLVIFFFLLIFLILNFMFKKKKEIYQIESGFQNLEKTSFKNFSINFFFLLIIFIIFDLELILILPIILKKNFFVLLMSMNFILITFLIEWMMKKILWKN